MYNFQDDNEGPVTKSIRLTSSLILRNLVIYSTNGKRQDTHKLILPTDCMFWSIIVASNSLHDI